MAVHPNPQRILVIGAGDGGVLKELIKYDVVKHIDLVEIDKMLVEVCRKYMRKTARAFDDPRVNIRHTDGLKYIRRCESEYDLIIIDSPDPFNVGEALFTREFYGSCHNALTEDGIMVNQHESPFYKEEALAMIKTHKRIKDVFNISRVYQAHIPTYPSGHWLFGFASKLYHPVREINKEWRDLGIKTRYYNPNLHRGSFALPTYVEEMLKTVE
jgi:spermidine synthase